MNDSLFEARLRSVLADLVPDEVPASLLDAAAALDSRIPQGRSLRARAAGAFSGKRTLAGAAGVAAALVIVIVGGILVARLSQPSVAGPGSGDDRREFVWATGVAQLAADSLTIEVGERVFRAPADGNVSSDPGTWDYRTLEMIWFETGTEMRLNIYFAADEESWWIREIRTYDGGSPGDWIYYAPPGNKILRGQSVRGDIDLFGSGRRGGGRLRIDGAVITAFAPVTGRRPFEACRMVGPVPLNPFEPVASEMNPGVAGVALSVGMSARAAATQLTAEGICHEFRFEFPASNLGQVWCVAPPGPVREWAFGSSGEVILFVEAGPRETLEPDAPQFVTC